MNTITIIFQVLLTSLALSQTSYAIDDHSAEEGKRRNHATIDLYYRVEPDKVRECKISFGNYFSNDLFASSEWVICFMRFTGPSKLTYQAKGTEASARLSLRFRACELLKDRDKVIRRTEVTCRTDNSKQWDEPVMSK